MLKHLLCICLIGIVPIVLASQMDQEPIFLYKLYPRNEYQIEFLKEVAKGNSSEYRYNGKSPSIVTPLSQGKTAYVFVSQSAGQKFFKQVQQQHLRAVLVDFTTITQLSVSNKIHRVQTFPQSVRASGVIQSPRVTNWGDWGGWGECFPGQFVVGMRLKTEPKQGGGDDSALNAIRLMCATPGSQNYKEIQSLEGPYGDFGLTFYCPSGTLARGFELRSESNQGDGDDTAANNLRLHCSDNNGGNERIVEGDGQSWGGWTAAQSCGSGQALCGLRTQVEPGHGQGMWWDDSALNNVDMACCDLVQLPYSPPGGAKGVPIGLIASILETAAKYAAPFIETALKRLHAGIFGSDRAFRSFDVTIFNTHDKKFQMTSNGCRESGGWSSTLLPEFEIPPHKSIAYGAESHGVLTGATGCRVDYKSADGSTFWISVSNPTIGKISFDFSSTSDIKIMPIVGNGNNNEGRFILY